MTFLVFEQIINGLIVGSMYALLGSGLALVYGTMRMLNFAHGEMFMLGGFGVYFMVNVFGLPAILAIPITLALVMAFACVVHLGALKPLLASRDWIFASIAMTLGLSITLQNAALLAWGERAKPIAYYVEGIVTVGEFRYPWIRIAIFSVAVMVMVGMAVFLARTRLGWAIRATSQDAEAAQAVGIDVRRVHLATFAISAALGALAGAMLAPILSVTPWMGLPMILKAFVVIILGGLGSFPGAIVGGLVLGVVESLGLTFTSSEWRDVFAFGLLILVIWIRPWGLMGKKPREG